MKINGLSFQEQAQALHDVWSASISGQCPPAQQFGTWLLMHNRNAERVEWAIRELAIKLTKRQMDDDYKVRFVSSIMSAKAREERQLQTQR